MTKLAGEGARRGVYQCNACREQFTVTVNSVTERSHIPLRKWVVAFHRMCSSKKGVSALQLQRELGLESYKSAWHLARRIRHAMKDFGGQKLSGTVEADECYVGGKPRFGGPKSKGGRGTEKTPVAVLVECKGMVRAKAVDRVSSATVKWNIRVNVHPDAKILTDDFPAYYGIGRELAGGHSVVTHSANEYAHIEGEEVNSAESYFALLKRGHYGVFHHFSKQHLPRYLAEFSLRWNHRKLTDGQRTQAAIAQAAGKRLISFRPKAAGQRSST